MVQPFSSHRLLLAASLAVLLPASSALATSHHRHHAHHDAAPPAAAGSDTAPTSGHASHAANGCTAPLTADQHDPSVREVRLQRNQDGGGTVTMCLVSNQAVLVNPSASIGIFGKDGVLAGTAAKAMPGKFQPAVGPAGGLPAGQSLTVVPFSFDVPADPPLPRELESMAMVQLAWDSCPDEACAKPAEQSLALLQTIKITGGGQPAPSVASIPDAADDAAPAPASAPTKPSRHAHRSSTAHHDKPGEKPGDKVGDKAGDKPGDKPGEKTADKKHDKSRAAGSVASGQIY